MAVDNPLPCRLGIIAASLLIAACATPRAPTAANDAGAAQQNSQCALAGVASRIPPSGTQCAASGRSYSRKDIDNTGATTAGQALRLLDPSITVSH
jgi:hypothetical protein